MPALPWRPTELAAVLAGITELSELLTPCPIDAERFEFEPQLAGLSGSQLDRLDPWLRRNLDAVAQLEERCNDAAQGDSLIHFDLRADNLLLTATGVRFLDWPWACRAAAWVDLVGLLPSVAMQGGPPPDKVLAMHPLARGVETEAIDAAVAGVTGIFVCSSLEPDPPGLPTLRRFQAAQGAEAIGWLKARTGWK